MEEEKRLNKEERRFLLSLARRAIEEHLSNHDTTIEHPPWSGSLLVKQGAFVSLHKGEELRGCIGTFISDKPLYKTVMEMAIAAATQDFRFPPVTLKELSLISIEISVLSPLKKINDVSEIEVGRHGIYIVKGFNRGVLLPQVAVEYGWDREEFLEHTCLKAGLPPSAWKEGADIYIFNAEIFSDESEGSSNP